MSVLGLYDYGARFYSTLTGRFISPDPYVPDPSKPMKNVLSALTVAPPAGSSSLSPQVPAASGPYEELIPNPQVLNRYAYAGDNPLRYVDPTGFDMTEADWLVLHSALDRMHAMGLTDDVIAAGLLSGALTPLLATGYQSPTWSGTYVNQYFMSDEAPTHVDAQIWVYVDLGTGELTVVYVPKDKPRDPWDLPVIEGTVYSSSGESSDIEFEHVVDPNPRGGPAVNVSPPYLAYPYDPNTIAWAYSFQWDTSKGTPVQVYLYPASMAFVNEAHFEDPLYVPLTPYY